MLAAIVLACLPSVHPATAAARPTAPVVVVVFDEMPLVSLLDDHGRIDQVRYPNFAALARSTTWYPNATTVADATKLAIPSILDGRHPVVGRPATAAGHPHNLFTYLHHAGYRLKVHEEATSLCPYHGCRRTKPVHYFLSRQRPTRFAGFVRSIRNSRTPTLYYRHTLLPHVPWVFTPNLRRYDHTLSGPIVGLYGSDTSVFDSTLVNQAWQRHLLQVGAVDTLVGQVIARMKQTGLYDRAELVVMADHGISFRLGATDRREIVPANAFDEAPIPLFIKRPRQRHGKIDRSMVRTYDVLPTLAAQIGLKLPRGLSGRAASNRAVHTRGRVSVLSRAAVHSVHFTRARLQSGRNAALRRKLALFGSGRRSLYAFGPNARLRGRRLTDLRVLRRGRLRASLDVPSDYRHVSLRSTFVPAHVTGRIRGGRRGSRRSIAVAINGRIWGLTRSFHLHGRRSGPEYYSVIVNPAVFRPRRNTVQVFSVGRSHRRFILRAIR